MVKKRQITLGDFLDQKIISLYSLGTSYNDITGHIEDLYGVELSPALLTHITDKILPLITDWQSRPLDEIYPFVWMDAMFFKVKEGWKNRIQSPVRGDRNESGGHEGCFGDLFKRS